MPTHTWDPTDYERNSAQQQAWARELLSKLDLSDGDAVLDVGCGDGKVTAEIAARVPLGKIVGIDASAEMVELAAARFPPERHPNLCFAVADAGALAYREEFSVVFSNATLHWVIDHRPVLTGVARSLRPGGRTMLQMGGKGNAGDMVAAMVRVIDAPAWSEHFAGFSFPWGFYSPDEYEPWLIEAGLRPRRVELLAKDMVQAGREGLAGWLRTTWMPYLDRVPAERRDGFLAAVLDDYLARYPLDADGNAHVQMHRLEVEADKPADRPARR
jgi:trans-aconitate methyltransferase